MDVNDIVVFDPAAWLIHRAALLAEVRERSAERSFRRVVTALSESQSVTVNAIREFVENHPGLMTFIDERDEHDGWTLLHHAAANQAPAEVAKYLVGEYPIGLQVKTYDRGLLPLHLAVAYGMPIESIAVLTKAWRGALLERSYDNKIPLYAALAHAAPVEVVVYLVTEDPSTLQIQKDGFLPLHAAIHFHAPPGVVQFLTIMNPGAVRACRAFELLPFHLAIKRSDFKVAEFLLGEYPEVLEAKGVDGENSLHFAARIGTVAAAEWLVDRNPAHLKATTLCGQLPLHMAVGFNSFDVVQFFSPPSGGCTSCEDARFMAPTALRRLEGETAFGPTACRRVSRGASNENL